MDLHNKPLKACSLNAKNTGGFSTLLGFFKNYFGYTLAIIGLIWVLHNFESNNLFQHLAIMKWWLVILAIICDILSYVCQGLRWQLLLETTGKLSLLESTQAIYAGLFTNEVLPMRLGELVRLYLAAKSTKKKVSEILPSVIIERFLDAVWLALSIGMLAVFLPLPKDLKMASNILGIVIVIGIAVFFYIILKKQPNLTNSASDNKSKQPKIFSFIKTFLLNTIIKMKLIVKSRSFYLAAIFSLALLSLQILAFWLIMEAYGLSVSFFVATSVFLIIHLGTLVPNAPANIGSYHFFCVMGLMLFGVDKSQAIGFSIVVFTLLTLPLLLIGMIAISQTGLVLRNIPSELAKWKIADNN